ncbi:MAG: VOC family protein, partial [Deltaproteobacteria bacterium]|nr:VOC family protein [Deltaproteobacteria bacterium]
VVKNLEQTAENYWKILGIGPWAIFEWAPPLVFDRKYHGHASWAKERIALVQVGGVQLELVEPVEGESIYQDWLDQHGEGLHHMNFLVDDVDETVATLAQQGFPSVQSGRFGNPAQKNAFNYVEIKPLRTIWEPVHYE